MDDAAAARRRALHALGSRRRRAQFKRDVTALRDEARGLERQLASLRRASVRSASHERALAERRKHQQSEDVNRQLQRALAIVQTVRPPLALVNAGINMRELLHSYAHLPADPEARARAYSAICSPQKLGLAYQIVMRETRHHSPLTPMVDVRQVPSRTNELAVTSLWRFAVDAPSLEKAFLAAGSACFDCFVEWARFHHLHVRPRAKEIPTLDSRYAICEARYRSESTGEDVLFEECKLTHWQLNESSGVVVWDFVDFDELHPPTKSLDARQYVTAGLVVQKELCPDGVERVVCSAVCTKTYQFLPHGKPIVAADTMQAVATITKAIELCVMRVRQSIHKTIHNPPVAIGLT